MTRRLIWSAVGLTWAAALAFASWAGQIVSQVENSIIDALAVAAVTGIVSAIGTWAALKIEIRYLKRDVKRAQSTADDAHGRIDELAGLPGGRRRYDPHQ